MGKQILTGRLLIGAALTAFMAATPVLANVTSNAPAETRGPVIAASVALVSVLADYEAYPRRVDPISAGMDGDR